MTVFDLLDAWQGAAPGRRIYSVTVGSLPCGRCHVRLSEAPAHQGCPRRAASGEGDSREEATAKALRLWAEHYERKDR